MALGIFNSPFWQLIAQSDWVSKYVVLLGLFLLSISCVAIIIFKFITIKKHRENLTLIQAKLIKISDIENCLIIGKQYHETLGGTFILTTLNELETILEEKTNSPYAQTSYTLSLNDIEIIEIVMSQKIERLLTEEECYMPVLSTAAAVGPLIGLFGTIWGLIHSFISISQEKSADIATVAPGIAEALITTLAGLIVAIPALIAYNYFASELRKIENNLLEISDIISILIKKNYLNK